MLVNVRNRVPSFSEVLTVSIIFFLSAWLAIEFTREFSRIALVWVANGVLLGFLLTTPRAAWPRLVAGGLAANIIADLLSGDDVVKALWLSACNTVEILFIAFAVGRRFAAKTIAWADARDFLLFGVLLGPAIAAVLAAVYIAPFQLDAAMSIFKTWFMADAMGIALVTPLVVTLRRSELKALRVREGSIRLIAHLVLVAAVTVAVFAQSRYPLLFVIMPALILCAFRCGLAGLSIAHVICGLIALVMTVLDLGPLTLISNGSAAEKFFLTQAFILFAEITTVPFAIAVESHRRLEAQLAGANKKLEFLAGTDSLTGLPNRRSFDQVYEREWAAARRNSSTLAVAILDIDYFKSFNDTYGHLAGDHCLSEIGALLSNTVFRPGDFVGRYGGEEFIFILPNTDASGARRVCGRVMEIVCGAKIAHEGSPLSFITVSMGISVGRPDPKTNKEMLVEEADHALYRAKSGGRNRLELASEGQEQSAMQPYALATAR